MPLTLGISSVAKAGYDEFHGSDLPAGYQPYIFVGACE
jgi:hypothetical protein